MEVDRGYRIRRDGWLCLARPTQIHHSGQIKIGKVDAITHPMGGYMRKEKERRFIADMFIFVLLPVKEGQWWLDRVSTGL